MSTQSEVTRLHAESELAYVENIPWLLWILVYSENIAHSWAVMAAVIDGNFITWKTLGGAGII
jgi:hypothetical protein